MRKLLLAAAAVMALAGPALALDPSPEAIANTTKAGKMLHADEVAALMRQAEAWCYNEESGSCDWSEVYLSVDPGAEGIVYESANSWDADRDVYFVDKAQFKDERYVCEYGYDKVPSTRATRTDGSMIAGRELDALRADITANRADDTIDCFDYVFVSYDAGAGVMNLKQRQYVAGVVDPSKEAAITLHFNAADAAGLKLRY